MYLVETNKPIPAKNLYQPKNTKYEKIPIREVFLPEYKMHGEKLFKDKNFDRLAWQTVKEVVPQDKHKKTYYDYCLKIQKENDGYLLYLVFWYYSF